MIHPISKQLDVACNTQVFRFSWNLKLVCFAENVFFFWFLFCGTVGVTKNQDQHKTFCQSIKNMVHFWKKKRTSTWAPMLAPPPLWIPHEHFGESLFDQSTITNCLQSSPSIVLCAQLLIVNAIDWSSLTIPAYWLLNVLANWLSIFNYIVLSHWLIVNQSLEVIDWPFSLVVYCPYCLATNLVNPCHWDIDCLSSFSPPLSFSDHWLSIANSSYQSIIDH